MTRGGECGCNPRSMSTTLDDLVALEARILATIAWCDGVFDEAERMFYVAFLDESPVGDTTRVELLACTESAPDREALLDAFAAQPRPVRVALLQRAHMMAMANDILHLAEKAFLAELATRSGVKQVDVPKVFEMLSHLHEAARLEDELFGV